MSTRQRRRRQQSPQPFVLEYMARIPRERRAGLKVLDIPAGNGVLTIPLQAAGFDVTGCDLFPEYAERNAAVFRARGLRDGFRASCKGFITDAAWSGLFGDTEPAVPERPRVLRGDMETALPFADGQFDVVLCVEGIEHIDAQHRLVGELRRVLKPGGTLILTTPNILTLRTRLATALAGQRTLSSHIDEHLELKDRSAADGRVYHGHVFMLSYHQLRYALHSNGFRIRGVLPFPPSTSSLLLLPFLWKGVFLATFLNQRTARRRFRRLQREGAIPADATPPYADIRRHVLSLPALTGNVIMLEAEAV